MLAAFMAFMADPVFQSNSVPVSRADPVFLADPVPLSVGGPVPGGDIISGVRRLSDGGLLVVSASCLTFVERVLMLGNVRGRK